MYVSWSSNGTTVITATATAVDGISAGTYVSRRVDLNPVTGVASFYTSLDDVNYTQVGTTVTAASPAAMQVPTSTILDILLGEVTGGTLAATMNLVRVKMLVAGSTVFNGTCGVTGMTDSVTSNLLGKGSAVTVV